MTEDRKFTFEEIFQQNENRIYFHMHKLGIRDPHREFYTEGIYAMWKAYKNYQPDKGPMSTYFNYTIRNRLIDKIRKQVREQEMEEASVQGLKSKISNGNQYAEDKTPIRNKEEIKLEGLFWRDICSLLTENQWKWVYYYCIMGYTLPEIAEKEGVTVDAVKSWRKAALRRIRDSGMC